MYIFEVLCCFTYMLGRFVAALEMNARVLKSTVLLIYFKPFTDNHEQDQASHFKTLRNYQKL